MNCLDCARLLQRLLDGDPLPGEPAVQEHLAGCAECRERFEAAQRLLDNVDALKQTEAAPERTRHIVARVLEDRRVRLWRLRVSAGFALAASLLLAVVGYYGIRAPQLNSLANRPAPRQTPAAVDDPLVVTESVRELRKELVSTTQLVSDQAMAPTRLLPWAATAPLETAPRTSLPLEQLLASAGQALGQTTSTIVDTIQPVANITRRALSFFLQDRRPERLTNHGLHVDSFCAQVHRTLESRMTRAQ